MPGRPCVARDVLQAKANPTIKRRLVKGCEPYVQRSPYFSPPVIIAFPQAAVSNGYIAARSRTFSVSCSHPTHFIMQEAPAGWTAP